MEKEKQRGKLISNTMFLSVGDWVLMEEDDKLYKGWVAEILNRQTIKMFCMGFYKRGHYISVNKMYDNVRTASSMYSIYLDESITFDDVEDKRHLIDLTIDTKDEDWFKELAK